jgi:capsular exopolysaccharide synthesis family protein
MIENELHLKNYLRIILKRKFAVVTFFIVIFVIALTGSLNYTPEYTASTKLLIEKNDENPLMMNYRYGTYYDPEFLATQSQIIKSEPVSKKVVKALDLENTYASFFKIDQKPPHNNNPVAWFKDLYAIIMKTAGIGKVAPEYQDGEASPNDESDVEASPSLKTYIQMISNGIFIEPVEESDIVKISYTSTNPEFSKRVVNAVAKAYIEETLEMKMAASKHTIAWMTEKAEKERVKLKKKEEALQNYMRNENIITIEDRIAITPKRLTEISAQLTMAEVKRKELQSINDQVSQISQNLDDAETISVIASDATLRSIRSQLIETDQKITELSKKYGPKHPVIKRAQADANKLEEKRKKEITRIIQSIKNEFELARSSEENLRELLEKTKHEAVKLNEKNIQFGILKREIETNRLLYDALIKKIKEQSITDQAQTVDIWIVEEAGTPTYPSNERSRQRMTLGLLLGLFGGVGLAFFLEYLDQTVKSPDEVEKQFGISVLGMVPLLKSGENRPEKAVIAEPSFAFSESYKTIRAGILLSSAKKAPKTLLITSASPGEGKTTTAINLAVTLAAQSATKVLLIDADLRRPNIGSLFDLDESYGLSTFLSGVSDQEIIEETPVPNMSVITAGPIPPNPSELLSSSLMNDLYDRLEKKFDFIIIDSPPILSVSDGLLLSTDVDGTIIVIKAGKTAHEIVRRALKALNDIGSRVIGSILNAVDIKKSTYYYYGYKKYYHYYSSDKGGDGNR